MNDLILEENHGRILIEFANLDPRDLEDLANQHRLPREMPKDMRAFCGYLLELDTQLFMGLEISMQKEARADLVDKYIILHRWWHWAPWMEHLNAIVEKGFGYVIERQRDAL